MQVSFSFWSQQKGILGAVGKKKVCSGLGAFYLGKFGEVVALPQHYLIVIKSTDLRSTQTPFVPSHTVSWSEQFSFRKTGTTSKQVLLLNRFRVCSVCRSEWLSDCKFFLFFKRGKADQRTCNLVVDFSTVIMILSLDYDARSFFGATVHIIQPVHCISRCDRF